MDKNMNKLMPRIAIEGNIGSGKTTLLNTINVNAPIYFEPIHKWKFLEKSYEDPKQYAFIFQLEVLFSFSEVHMCGQPHVMERSTNAGYHVFGKHQYECGNMSEQEFQIFTKIWEQYNKIPTLILYLDVLPEICYERIIKRSRNGESNISLEYLQYLDQKYNDYLTHMSTLTKVVKLPSTNTDFFAKEYIKSRLRLDR